MRKAELFFTILISMAFILSCGGGGTGGPGPGPGQAGVYQFYYDDSGGLYAVDPSDPVHPVTVETSGTGSHKFIFSGTWDATAHQANNIHARYLVYTIADGIHDGIYKVSAIKSENLAKSRISNETSITQLCNPITAFDLKNPGNSRFLYAFKGTDNQCGTSDDIRKMVRLDMSSNDSPVTLPSGLSPVHYLMDRTDGSITGWLAHNTNTSKLQRCNAEFGSCIDLSLTDVQSAKHLGSDFSSTKEALMYYNSSNACDLCIYDYSNNNITFPGHLSNPSIGHAAKDSTGVYVPFRDIGGSGIYKLSFDGSFANLLVYGLAGDISQLILTDQRVIYLERSGQYNYDEISSIQKNQYSTPAALVTKTYNSIWFITSKGNKVFYSGDDGTRLFAGYVLDDDPNSVYEVQDAIWSYLSLTPAMTNNDSGMPSLSRMVRTDGCSRTVPFCANGTMKSFDASTYSSNSSGITIGQVPSDIYFVGFEAGLVGIGENALVGGGGGQVDVFFFKTDTPNSLQRITNTLSADEYPVF